MEKPEGVTHKSVDDILYKREVYQGNKVWWYVWQQDAWWVVSGEPSVILFPVK